MLVASHLNFVLFCVLRLSSNFGVLGGGLPWVWVEMDLLTTENYETVGGCMQSKNKLIK